MNEEDRKEEEVDVEPFEGDPDFEDSPSKQHVEEVQDVDDIDPEEGGQVVATPDGIELAVEGDSNTLPGDLNVPNVPNVPGTPRA